MRIPEAHTQSQSLLYIPQMPATHNRLPSVETSARPRPISIQKNMLVIAVKSNLFFSLSIKVSPCQNLLKSVQRYSLENVIDRVIFDFIILTIGMMWICVINCTNCVFQKSATVCTFLKLHH